MLALDGQAGQPVKPECGSIQADQHDQAKHGPTIWLTN